MAEQRDYKQVVVITYSNVEFYPPSLNAITCLASIAEKVIVVQANVTGSNWNYPENVQLKNVGKQTANVNFMAKSTLAKLLYFFYFTFTIAKHLVKADLVVVYDGLPLLPYKWARFFVRTKHLLWYHNHDVFENTVLPKYSLMAAAVRNEKKMFSSIDLFSLPALERKQFFPLENWKGKFFFLPNFPAKFFYGQFNQHKLLDKQKVQLIFQGAIAAGHGLEEIIAIMPVKTNIELVLAGFINIDYKNELIALATKYNVINKVHFKGRMQYGDLPKLTASCQIGLAIYAQKDSRMKTTLGTAGNKIYEYAACGLPILYFDNTHYNQYLKQYDWALATDLTSTSLLSVLETIENNYDELSKKAVTSFRTDFYFEKEMKYVLDYLIAAKNG